MSEIKLVHPQSETSRALYWMKLSPEYQERRTVLDPKVLYVPVTRFNLQMTAERKRVRPADTNEDDWLAERIRLFRRFCLPSIVGQTIRPHAWVIMFDHDITPRIGRLLDQILEHDWIIPLFFRENWRQEYVDEIRETLDRRFHITRFHDVCTIRLDSDDALNRHWIAATDQVISDMAGTWNGSRNRCVDFSSGIRWYQGGAYEVRQTRQFFSLVEPRRAYRTCYRVRHLRVNEVAETVAVETGEPMFIYQVHGFATTSNPAAGGKDWVVKSHRNALIPAEEARRYFRLRLPESLPD